MFRHSEDMKFEINIIQMLKIDSLGQLILPNKNLGIKKSTYKKEKLS